MTNAIELAAARVRARSGEGRRLRRRAGLTLEELAEYVGVVPSTLLRWERGDFRPRGLVALRYAQALDALARLLAEHDSGQSFSRPTDETPGPTQ